MKPLTLLASLLVLPALALGCDTPDSTFAVIDDGYPSVPEGGDPSQTIAVYEGWWLVATFPTPVPGGGESETERVVTGTDYAYLVLAPGWDPSSGTPPPRLLPAMTRDEVSVARGDTLHIQVDDAHVAGNCAAGQPLTQDQADYITHSIFPGAFAAVVYDAASCTSRPAGDAAAPDAGALLEGGSVDAGTAD
jgi:hypothetical protein